MESSSAESSRVCSEPEIRAELDRLLASREFSHADRLSRFLRFVVDRTLAGDRDSLKESVIGTSVYDRAPGYDPKVEPIVRTEARRLRAKLEEYYKNSGRDAQVHISMPTGGYVAVFQARPGPRLVVLATEPQAAAIEPARHSYIAWIAAGVCILAIAGFAAWRFSGKRTQTEYVLTTVTSYPGAQHSPAISPDGRQVAFTWAEDKSRNADLYVVASEGGTPKRLTTAHAADNLPAWSHDGTEIAFIRADTLMVVSPSGGGERPLGPAFPSWLSWAPDANVILVSDWVPKRRVLALYAVDEASGSRRQVTFPADGITGDTAGAISPDGKRLAFIRCDLGNCDIYMTPYGKPEAQRVTHDECGFAGLAWIPDGSSIVYSSRRRGPYMLWQVNASGGDPEQVASSGDDARAPRVARGPSGKVRIVFDHTVNIANIWRQPLNPESGQPPAAAQRPDLFDKARFQPADFPRRKTNRVRIGPHGLRRNLGRGCRRRQSARPDAHARTRGIAALGARRQSHRIRRFG